jgi:opine dehydrogenase
MKDISHLENKPIAVLGAGAAGRTHAADCKLGNAKEVRLYESPEFAKSLGSIANDGHITLEGPQVNLYGFERSGTAKIDLVTTDIKQAVSGAGIIIVAMAALGFDKLFDKLIPCLEDGQFIHFPTGNFGSLLLRHKMTQANNNKKVVIGEWSSQPYGTRIKTIAGVQLPICGILYRAITLKAAALPHSDTDLFIESAKYIPSMDAVRSRVKGDTVLDICFTNVNPVLHCPGTILGASVMENYGVLFGDDKYRFSIYSHAFSPSVSEVQYAFFLEQKAIANALGFEIDEYEKSVFFTRTNVLGSEFLGPDNKIPLSDRYELLETTGPFTIHNRYITEDIPVGCCVQRALGNKFGVKTPVIDSMVTLASVMTGNDFNKDGWTLEKLGIANMDKAELLSYVR